MQSIFNDSYNKYFEIIEEARSMGRTKLKKDHPEYEYFENHHIIPDALGGSDKNKNMVLLTPEEHYICHSLLPDFCEGESKAKMLHAWNVCNNVTKDGIQIIGSKKYGDLKRDRSKSMTGSKHPGAKKVYQFDKEKRTLIKVWGCVMNAADYLDIDFSLIASAARGRQKSAGGFIWSYDSEFDPKTLIINSHVKGKLHHKSKKICQIDKDTNELIKVWDCIVDAARYVNGNNSDITTKAKKKKGTAFGFKWLYPKDYSNACFQQV